MLTEVSTRFDPPSESTHHSPATRLRRDRFRHVPATHALSPRRSPGPAGCSTWRTWGGSSFGRKTSIGPQWEHREALRPKSRSDHPSPRPHAGFPTEPSRHRSSIHPRRDRVPEFASPPPPSPCPVRPAAPSRSSRGRAGGITGTRLLVRERVVESGNGRRRRRRGRWRPRTRRSESVTRSQRFVVAGRR